MFGFCWEVSSWLVNGGILCAHMIGREENKLNGFSSYKTTNLILRPPTFMTSKPKNFPKASSPNVTLGVGLKHEWGERTGYTIYFIATTFTMLFNHHPYSFPELFHHPRQNCVPINSHYTPPPTPWYFYSTFYLYVFAYYRQLIQMESFSSCLFVSGLFHLG